jgi:hypothetical protein
MRLSTGKNNYKFNLSIEERIKLEKQCEEEIFIQRVKDNLRWYKKIYKY